MRISDWSADVCSSDLVAGALTSGAIREDDLIAGRWDGARVALFAVDWADPAATVALGEGTIGAVETKDGGFTAELRGAAAALDRPGVEAPSPECRADMGRSEEHRAGEDGGDTC